MGLKLKCYWVSYWATTRATARVALVAGPPLPVIEEVSGASVVTDEELPLMKAWFGWFLAVDAVRAALPDRDRLLAANKARREQILSSAA